VPVGAGPEPWRTVDRAVVNGESIAAWDEAVTAEFLSEPLPLADRPSESCWTWALDAAEAVEIVCDERNALAARILRRRRPILAAVRIATEPCGPLLKIRIRVENLTRSTVVTLAQRATALRESLAGTHAILAIEKGAFVSLLDPPAAFSGLAGSCVNTNTFPVLVGSADSRDVMLASPIILYDYPAVAPESRGDLCDGTEIDELLTLRVRTLTDDEKREARATDPRAARILDQCEGASPQDMAALHGAVRSFESFLNPDNEPAPEDASVDVAGIRIARGSRVRLQPARITDSLDICVAGRIGTVRAVYRTLEDRPYVAVTVNDDPFAAEGEKYRRALFFHPEELEPIDEGVA
jgi:hypothetical protein